jgi:hypothetical protein
LELHQPYFHLTFSASTQAVRLCQSYSVIKERCIPLLSGQ